MASNKTKHNKANPKNHLQNALKKAKQHPRLEIAVPLNKFKECTVAKGTKVAYAVMTHGVVPLGILCNKRKLKTEYRITVHPFESIGLEHAIDQLCEPTLFTSSARKKVKTKPVKKSAKKKRK